MQLHLKSDISSKITTAINQVSAKALLASKENSLFSSDIEFWSIMSELKSLKVAANVIETNYPWVLSEFQARQSIDPSITFANIVDILKTQVDQHNSAMAKIRKIKRTAQLQLQNVKHPADIAKIIDNLSFI